MRLATLSVLVTALFESTSRTIKISDFGFQKWYEDNLWFSEDPRDTRFYLYSDPRMPDEAREITLGKVSALKTLQLARDQPVYIYVHGFHSNVEGGGCKPLRHAFLHRGLTNVICIDWSKLAADSKLLESNPLFLELYLIVIKNAVAVGGRLGKFMRFLIKHKVVSNFDRFHLVGHSLGSHVIGVAGRYVQEKYKKKVGRITGLDPSGPFYQVVPANDQLGPSNAKYVEVLHVDSYLLGMSKSVGHVDFFINGGYSQPACEMRTSGGVELTAVADVGSVPGCNHVIVVEYYERVILGEDMTGCPCQTGSTMPVVRTLLVKPLCTKAKPCRRKHLLSLTSKSKGNFYLIVPKNPPPKIKPS